MGDVDGRNVDARTAWLAHYVFYPTGIVFTEGPRWTCGRRLMLKFLKNFGYGTNAMEAIIAAECKALVELRMTDASQHILVNEMFDVTIMNILWRLMAGKR